MTGNLIVGKNVIVWTLDGTKLDKIPLINPQNVASITRWDNGKEVRYVPGGKNPAIFTNLVKNVIYLFEVKQSFQLPSATLILSVAAPTPTPTPTPTSTPTPSPSPAPTSTPVPSPTAGIMNYSQEKAGLVGYNLGMQHCFPPAFANAFLTSRPEWQAASWTGNTYNLSNTSISVDEKGNPLADGYNIVWEGGDKNEGTYWLKFSGKARVISQFDYGKFPDFGNTSMKTADQGYDAATNTTIAKMVVASGFQNFTLIFVETQAVAGGALNTGVRNLKLIRPVALGSSVPHAESETFNRAFVAATSAFDVLRFMDGTNWNQQVTWADRTHPWENQGKYLPNESTYERNGVAIEYNILLCNQAKKDFWLNIPHLADDNWIENAVLTILFGSDGTTAYRSVQANPVYPPLDSSLKCYVEMSNEVWNFAFGQAHDIIAKCHQLVSVGNTPLNYDGETNEVIWAWRYAIMRLVIASRLFRKWAGDSAMGARIRPCYFFQYANYQDTASVAFRFLLDYYGSVGDLWGAGGATYFQSNNDAAGTVDGIFASGIPQDINTQWIEVESYWAHLYRFRLGSHCMHKGRQALGSNGGARVCNTF